MAKSIIVAERDNIAAVVENGKVTDFFVHKGDILLSDVYLATVDNILPSIDAAFVNVGSDKMGFLHANDAIGKGSLKDKLSPKQKLIVQVVKEPTGHKGPRVTTSISLPGRFLVLMPHETGVNVSRKIVSPKERARLKSVVSLFKPVGVGVIVRTEAENQSDADIQEDLEVLLEKWNSIITAAETHAAPSLLYRDQDLLYRVIREACSEDVKEIVLDTSFAMHRTQQILQNWNMNKDIEVSVYKGTEPLLVASGVAKDIKAALQTKVNLPCGGYLFIQTTEALTVIDVNSGKFVSSATQDETILKTNKEAVQEIARQLRLRNIGGMIIVDFIDMTKRNDKLAIMEEFELALENDKSKPQIGQLSDLGLVELTRHRQGQTLSEIFSKKCPHCGGTGQIAEDLSFSTSVAEGEYKAKAAKLKLPIQQVKNKNQAHKHNKVFNHQNQPQENKPQQQENQNIQTPKDAEPSSTPQENTQINQNKPQQQENQNPQGHQHNQNRPYNNKFNKFKHHQQNNAPAVEIKEEQTKIESQIEITKAAIEKTGFAPRPVAQKEVVEKSENTETTETKSVVETKDAEKTVKTPRKKTTKTTSKAKKNDDKEESTETKKETVKKPRATRKTTAKKVEENETAE